MSFLTSRKFVGAKIESVRYTAETLAETDYDLPAYNVSYSSTIDQYDRPVALSNFSKLTSVPGKSMATCSFTIDVSPGDSADMSVVPAWGKLLEGCGFRKYEMAGGISWVTDSTQCTTLTIEITDTEECTTPGQRVVQLSGCMGSVTFSSPNVGEPVHMNFTFTGQINSVTDRVSAFNSTNVLTTTPDSVLGATVAAGGYTDIDSNAIEMAMNIEVQMEVDPSDSSGYRGAHITNRAPTVTIDPYMADYATRDWYAQNLLPDGNLNPMYLVTSNFTYYFRNMQVVNSLQDGDRNGLVTEGITLKSVSAPYDDSFYLLQGVSG